jgi:histone-lysine N-methyltransferase SETD3
MDFAISEGNSVRLVAPFADMLNHAPDAKQCHAYDLSTGNLSVLACRDYQAGDQVCSKPRIVRIQLTQAP